MESETAPPFVAIVPLAFWSPVVPNGVQGATGV